MEGTADSWREFFTKWPAGVERRGVLVTTFNELVPFSGFAISPTLLLLDRAVPDTSGARKVIVGYQQIAALKLTDVLKLSAFQAAGFTESRPAK